MARSPLPIVTLALAAAALAPAAAHAAPHWSSPSQVIGAPPGDTTSVGAPQAAFGPRGAPLAFGGDGANPVVLTGSIAGGLTATKLSATGGVARGAIGADGTRAAVWTDNGTARLAIAAPGGAFGAATDLPGARVNAVEVAVAPDGTTWVVWRTHGQDGRYEVFAATAPKGGALGGPLTIASGTAPVNTVDVAAGPNGAVAVGYTRSGRSQVAVRPAGAVAFEPPQAVSATTKADHGPHVAFNADGTIVAAWGNPDGAQVAFRRPGQAAFEPAAGLGAPGYAMDLEETPQGGTAVTFAGNGAVHAGVQAPGGGFATSVVGSAPGNIPPAPEIAVDAAGTVTVVYADTQSGEVRAVRNGAATHIGYGTPGVLTPTTVAAGPANQAIALWVDGDRGLSAATYGDDAPANRGPGAQPAGTDRKAPRLRLRSPKRLAVTAKTATVKLKVRVSEAAAIGVSGSIRTTVAGKRRIAPIITTDVRRTRIGRAGTRTVMVRLGRFAGKDLRRAVRARRGAQAFLLVEARDKAGNLGRLRVQVTLKPKRAQAKRR